MSATIAANDLSFFIFGSGHDYTLNNSGTGEGAQWFSHPFMAKGSRAYAGMYYFLVADENGDLIDAVKDDIAHCTFTPALGDTFDTVGEQEIRVDYRHEYIYDDETLVVEKHLKQKITVVDHGAVTTSYYNQKIYEDGYCYVHPTADYVSRYNGWFFSGSFKKLSSFPWGTVAVYNISTDIEDISELAYADMSGFTSFNKMFYSCSKLTNLSGVETWDTSNVTDMAEMFYGCNKLVSIEGVENWNTAKVTKMYNTFGGCTLLADLTPLSTWDTSKASTLQRMFWGCGIVTTDGLENFTFESTNSLYQMFYACKSLTDLKGISGWNVSNINDMAEMFSRCSHLTNLKPLKDWDVSNVQRMTSMFGDTVLGSSSGGRLTSLDGLEDWDVSNVKFFDSMFSVQFWLDDISALSHWDVSSGINFSNMFLGMACLNLTAISGWDMSSATTITSMFNKGHKADSSQLGKYVIDVDGGSTYFDYDGTSYRSYQLGTITFIEQDASAVAGWTVPSGQTAFFDGGSTTWTNIPSWN